MSSIIRLKDTYLRLLPPYLTCVNSTLSPGPSSIALPEDVLVLICQSYVEFVLCEAKTVWDLREKRKEYWIVIAPLTKTSTYLRKIVLGIWQTVWATCCAIQCLSHTRCHGGHLPPGVRILTLSNEWESSALELAPLKKLQCLSIGYHNLLRYDSSQGQFQILPGVKALPSSLRRLEILHFHGPTQHFLSLIKSCCPKLIELRLSRCTMFDHPEYDVRDHAATLVSYVEGLAHLEQLHVQSYFADTGSVLRHRLDHRQYHPRGHRDRTNPVDGIMMHNPLHLLAQAPQDGPPLNHNAILLAEKILWTVACPQCERELKDPIEAAECLAASLLSASHKSLKIISFGGFLSPGRTVPSEWMVLREYEGDRLIVWAQRPVTGRHCPRYRYEFERPAGGAQWSLVTP
ncbi:unnamed protein product [Rhizoctonia solani]|uniref:F-box domain-containing protein n=1 Tax=Rhizoctonia solani TaxID=456999 RepID=A0A8H2XDQ9_9AGAM|nr:unnamed protein product [Rhizoctonia solani]